MASPVMAFNSSQHGSTITTEDLFDLSPGLYTVTVTNLATCQDSFPFMVDSIPPFEVETTLIEPTCGGGTDGAIELTIQNGANPILIDFGMGESEVTTSVSYTHLTLPTILLV